MKELLVKGDVENKKDNQFYETGMHDGEQQGKNQNMSYTLVM